MGLRERNAARTRDLILEAALDLFVERGFEPTRMEEIAEHAEIGASTLYRYFPSKDLLLTEPLALHGQMAEALRTRPADEPLALALGHALTALVSTPRPDTERLRRIFFLLDSAPSARARLLDDALNERIALERAIADRLDRPPDDLFCTMTARMTMSVLELINVTTLDAPNENTAAAQHALDALRGMLSTLSEEPPALPVLGPSATAGCTTARDV